MKRNVFIILLLIFAFALSAGCTKNADGPITEEPDLRPRPASAAPSATAEPGTSKSYFTVEKNGRQGVVNERGQIVMPFEYSKIDVLYCGGAPAAFFAVPAVVKTTGQESSDYRLFYDGFLFDLNGRPIYKDKCSYAYPICDGLINLYNAEKYGVISYEGAEVIPLRYNNMSLCGDYIAAVTGFSYSIPGQAVDVDIYSKDGALQNSGRVNFSRTDGGLIMVTDDTGAKYGLVNTRFEEVVPAELDELYYVSSGLYVARRGEKYGVIDSLGEEVISAEFNRLDSYGELGSPASITFSASNENGAYVFDQDGKQLYFSDKYTYVFIQNGMMTAQDKSNMSHYINQEGEDVVPPAENIFADTFGLIKCYNSGVCTCYTKDGVKLPLPETNTIIVISPQRFVFLSGFNWLCGICDAGGNVIVPAKYTYLYSCLDIPSLVVFMETDKFGKARYGVIDASDGGILLGGFDLLYYANGGLFYATKGTVRGLIDINGSWTWQTSDYEALMD